jgi:beta-lactamase superfamily II metal-dependent hydrolase
MPNSKPPESANPLSGSELSVPPTLNEVEVSVFGPGYGESIFLHVGQNNWFIVDSCIHPEDNIAAPLKYLQTIGVDPATSVKQVIATHWHDDHVRGLAQIVEACTDADFVCTEAFGSQEFLQLLLLFRFDLMSESTGVNEFGRVLQILQERSSRTGKKITPVLAVANRLLWRNSKESSHPDIVLYSLSPSDTAMIKAKLDFAKLLPSPNEPKRRIVSFGPNHAAVVLHATVGSFSILLGSDIEETGDPSTGWSVIVASSVRPTTKASFYKISHHGSATGDHEAIWSEMLESEPYAVLTTFENGRNRLPTQNDVERICTLTGNAYSTAIIGQKRKTKRHPTVERTIRETVRSIKRLNTSVGQVRFRTDLKGTSNIELFGDALPLSELYRC